MLQAAVAIRRLTLVSELRERCLKPAEISKMLRWMTKDGQKLAKARHMIGSDRDLAENEKLEETIEAIKKSMAKIKNNSESIMSNAGA
jgi:hypothetical protein